MTSGGEVPLRSVAGHEGDRPRTRKGAAGEAFWGAGAGRWLLHVDMDAFYASVEARDDPKLRGVPLIVGGTGRRGVVASCSYEARAYGVRSAMPAVQARQLCPHAVFVAGRYDRYAEVSTAMHEIFARFTPVVEGISLDEAFLDVSGATRLFGSPAAIGAEIRRLVAAELGLSCSVGGATVKFLAKLASEAAKPSAPAPGGSGRIEGAGVVIIPAGGELDFLHPLPIEAMWGVGPATAKRLRSLGMRTIGDLAAVPESVLEGAVGKASGRHLAQLARGIDDRQVVPHRDPKSVSHEETYALDRFDLDGLKVELVRMADSVATRLRKAGLVGRTLTIKVRYSDFSTITRSATLRHPTDDAAEIARLGGAVLGGVDLSGGVRLLGVGMSNLSRRLAETGRQLALDVTGPPAGSEPAGGAQADRLRGDRPAGAARAGTGSARSGTGAARTGTGAARTGTGAAVDAIRARFGPAAVGPAALLAGGRLRVKRPGDTQWGPGSQEGSD